MTRWRIRDEIEGHGGFPSPDAPLPDIVVLLLIAIIMVGIVVLI